MLVGQDVSIDVCKGEGYVYVNFNTKEFKRDKAYRVMRKYPYYDELKGQYHTDIFLIFFNFFCFLQHSSFKKIIPYIKSD